MGKCHNLLVKKVVKTNNQNLASSMKSKCWKNFFILNQRKTRSTSVFTLFIIKCTLWWSTYFAWNFMRNFPCTFVTLKCWLITFTLKSTYSYLYLYRNIFTSYPHWRVEFQIKSFKLVEYICFELYSCSLF